MKKTGKETVLFSFKSSLPVMAGYIVLGIGFGILLNAKGFGWQWAFGMSTFIYAGSMQYVAVDLMGSASPLITVAIMTVMVNIRHLFYGISMIGKYKDTKPYKPYLIFALTDETFSIACNPGLPDNVNEKDFYFFLSLFDHFYWIFGSVIGSVLGNIIPFSTDGIDFSMTALFLVIVVNQWESEKNHIPALTGFIISITCLVVCRVGFDSTDFLIPAMILITVALLIERKIPSFEKAGNKNG